MDYTLARKNMVDCQLRTNRVQNPKILEAFLSVPRELFVSPEKAPRSYSDEDVAIDDGRYLMEPAALGRLLDYGQIKPTDVVLEIGSATGYASALLAKLCLTVIGIETNLYLIQKAKGLLEKLNVDNVVFFEGPLEDGYPDKAPYDVVFINGGVEHVPDGLRAQVREGGCLFYVDYSTGVGRAVLEKRIDGKSVKKEQFDVAVPVLRAFEKPSQFRL